MSDHQPPAASGTCLVPFPPLLSPPPTPSSSLVFHHPGGCSHALSGISPVGGLLVPPPQPQASITELGKRPLQNDLQEDSSNKKMKGLESTVSVNQMEQGLWEFFNNYHHGLQNEDFNVGGTSTAAATDPILSGAQDDFGLTLLLSFLIGLQLVDSEDSCSD